MMLSKTEFQDFLISSYESAPADNAHDIAHIERVVKNAERLIQTEEADQEIVIAAAWLHDCVILPKNHPDRKKASTLAAKKAVRFLKENTFPKEKIDSVAHAIIAHSYSAGIVPQTAEARIVQDADRLDALGAIGIARCFLVGGALNRALYHPADPFCIERKPDDTEWNVDHFYEKLLKLPGTMNTYSAKNEALRRANYMKAYLEQLREEIE